MSTGSHGLKVIASLAVLALTYAALASCGGGGSRPATGGGTSDQIIIEPRPPRERRPDLDVTSPSVSNSRPTAGAPFTLSATVRNAGDGESAATMLRYYRSTDPTITIEDTEVGILTMSPLAASRSVSRSVELTAPSTPGTYYYGACADVVTDEPDTANNCSPAVEVTVRDTQLPSQGRPDLEVGTPTVSDTSPETGASFTFSASVRNAGDGESPSTTLRYYQSEDATITTSDTAVGTAEVGEQAASGTRVESVSLTAPATAGTYYYGACVDGVTDESDTTNNCSASVKVEVEVGLEEPTYPDLVMSTSITYRASEATVELTATVRNRGDAYAAATTLRIYRSDSATSMGDEVAHVAIGALSVSATTYHVVILPVSPNSGTYYYGACVDSVARESDIHNNCSSSVVTLALPDLMVHRPGVSEQFPDPGEEIRLSAYVENVGEGDAPETTLRYFKSADRSISTSDTEVGTNVVWGLAPRDPKQVSITLNAPSADGTHYYGACVHAVAGETDTTNNCSRSVAVTLSSTGPDLIARQMRLSYPPEVKPGDPVRLWVQVFNAGRTTSAATTMRFYRSDDDTISASDTAMGTVAVPALDEGDDSWPRVNMTAPAAGTYYYGGCIDAVSGESHTTNNCSDGIVLRVTDGN